MSLEVKRIHLALLIIVILAFLVFIWLASSTTDIHGLVKPNSIIFNHYTLPGEPRISGKDFVVDKQTFKTAQKLISQLELGATVSDVKAAKVVPVTAVSSNHYSELMAHIYRVPKFVPNVKVLVYDLGLRSAEIKALRSITFVEYKRFDFSMFPSHVGNLRTYAWKQLIIQQVLAEFGGVLWMDTSIKIQQNISMIIAHMAEKQSGFAFYCTTLGHSIKAATHPSMFEYLPMKNHSIRTIPMWQASALLLFNTHKVRHDIMRWAIVCSLVKDCIAPVGAKLHCKFKNPLQDYAGCHRFDQSMISILVANAYEYRDEKYAMGSIGFGTMERISTSTSISWLTISALVFIVLIIVFLLQRKLLPALCRRK